MQATIMFRIRLREVTDFLFRFYIPGDAFCRIYVAYVAPLRITQLINASGRWRGCKPRIVMTSQKDSLLAITAVVTFCFYRFGDGNAGVSPYFANKCIPISVSVNLEDITFISPRQ